MANVSSIAVWIRLNELPIEYYNEEALVQIGKSIGTVLRIDTHTASETRGRLCFDCGRVGHQRENCPYTMRQDIPPKTSGMEVEGEVAAGSCSLHVADVGKDKGGPTGSVLNAEHKEAYERAYGPWVVVARKKTRNFRSSGTSSPQDFVPSRQVQGMVGFAPRSVYWPVLSEHNNEALRETKRKHSTPKVIDGAQLGNVLQGLRNVSNHQAQHVSVGGPSLSGLKTTDILKGKDKGNQKIFSKVSVKGKKDFVRARLHKAQSAGADEGSSPSVSLFEILPSEESPLFNTNGDRHQGEPSKFQFSAKLQLEMDAEI
nr:hypothetical protein CFP56_02139 [Quercus suber]